MSLVQYSSSSDEESEEESITQPSRTQVKKIAENPNSIANFLPQPKNRTPPKKAVVHSGIKPVLDHPSSISDGNRNTVNKRVSAFVPTSVKMRNLEKSRSEADKPIAKSDGKLLNVFQNISRPKRPREEDKGVTLIESYEKSEPVKEIPIEDNKGNETLDKTPQEEIREFNVTDFYEKNFELQETGQLQTNKSLHRLTNNRNQLSSLIKNAQLDSDVLLDKIEQRKKSKKEKSERYGW